MPIRDVSARAEASHPRDPAEPPCPACAASGRALGDALAERDALLLELARERERSAALLLAWPREDARAAAAVPPRRRVADAVNERVKRTAPGLHAAAKTAGLSVGALARRLSGAPPDPERAALPLRHQLVDAVTGWASARRGRR